MKNLLIEKDVLGWCLADDAGFSYCDKRIRQAAFEVPQHRVIWGAMCDVSGQGKSTRYAETHARLIETGMLAEAGGQPYLWELYQASFPSPQRAKFANKLGAIARARRVTLAVQASIPELSGNDPDASVDRFVEKVVSAAKVDYLETELVSLATCLDDALEHYDAVASGAVSPGISSGIRSVDEITTRHRGGDLVIIGARPSVGKSAYAVTQAIATGKETIPTAIFSLEMTRRDIAFRFLAGDSGTSLSAIRSGKVPSDRLDAVANANRRLRHMPIHVFAGSKTSSPNATLQGIQSMARKFREKHRQHREGLIVVDYLQLIQTMQGISEQKRHEIVGAFSRGLKGLAMELDWPVMALAQLNRKAEDRERPKLADLRESGDIEQDADCVILLHRPHKDSGTTGQAQQGGRFMDFGGRNNVQQPGDPNATEYIIAKNRNGPIGIATGEYMPECTLFR